MGTLNYDQELANLNAQRRFPFDSQATCKDATGSYEIPANFLCDLSIAVPASLELTANSLYLSRVTASATGWTLFFSYGATVVASCSIPVSSARRYAQFAIVGLSPYEDIGGAVMVWSTESISQQSAGDWTFAAAGGAIDPAAVRPQLRGVQRLRIVNQGQRSAPLTGDFELVPRNYQRINVSREPGTPQVFFSAEGSELADDCACGDASDQPCVKAIGPVLPDAEGRIFLRGSSCIEVTNGTNEVLLTDNCCAPCESCEPLEEMTRVFELLKARAEATEALTASLAAVVAALEVAVNTSNIGEGTCPEA